ncbi:hypothetical protein [Polaribacter sp.]|uniref:hypothetical protein n=1 Tax=Polaribacter sp. TaxID=1920175 RepID=UPI003EF863DB
MKTKILLPLLFLLLLLSSCNEDNIVLEETQSIPETIKLEEISVLNGRLYFPNKSTFQNYYENIKEKDEYEIADILENKFYSQDFYSLRPIVNEKTAEYEISRHLNKVKSNKKGLQQRSSSDDILDDIDDLEDVFGEEVFTSFLNQEAELQVGDKIYKYTDTGLFISEEKEITNLNNYLDTKQISRNFLEPTSEVVRNHYIQTYNRCGGFQPITADNGDFQHFINENEDCGGSGGSGSGSGSGSGNGSGSGGTNSYAQYQSLANNLGLCTGSSPWFGNLFGNVKVCKDEYESRRRVKIKYWNINFGIGYSIGMKVKHQYRGWTGVWRKEDTDNVVLGINSVSWMFNRNYVLPTNNLPTRYYVFDGKTYQTQGAYDSAVYLNQGTNSPVPQIPFANDVDIVVEFFSNDFGLLDTELKVRQKFYNFVYDRAKDILSTYNNRELRKAIAIVHTNTETWIQYYDFSKDCSNCKKLDKIFDWGIATPSVTIDLFQGYSFNNVQIGSLTMDFNKPDLTGLSVFGMAKRNGEWHGKRMEF